MFWPKSNQTRKKSFVSIVAECMTCARTEYITALIVFNEWITFNQKKNYPNFCMQNKRITKFTWCVGWWENMFTLRTVYSLHFLSKYNVDNSRQQYQRLLKQLKYELITKITRSWTCVNLNMLTHKFTPTEKIKHFFQLKNFWIDWI